MVVALAPLGACGRVSGSLILLDDEEMESCREKNMDKMGGSKGINRDAD